MHLLYHHLERTTTKKEIGLWVDHREATIVILLDGEEEIKHIISNSGKHIRYSGSSHSKTPEGLKEVTSEDQWDRKFGNNLNKFYDEIISNIRDTIGLFLIFTGEPNQVPRLTPANL